jgi:hypothetical protein
VNGTKSAVIRFPDGAHRLLYSLESPESWFEDFGRAKLARGRVKVKLDRKFVAVADTKDYQVFLTPEGDSHGLFLSAKNGAGFEVREQQIGRTIGTSSIAFSYRLVARRKDVKASRFKRIKLPQPPKMPAVKMVKPPFPDFPKLLRSKRYSVEED